MEWTHTYVREYEERDTVNIHNTYKGRNILWPNKLIFMGKVNPTDVSYYDMFCLATENPDTITWVGPKFSYFDIIEHRETKRRLLIQNISWTGSYSEPKIIFTAIDIDYRRAVDSTFKISNTKAEDYELIAYFDFEKDDFEFIKEISNEDKFKILKMAFYGGH